MSRYVSEYPTAAATLGSKHAVPLPPPAVVPVVPVVKFSISENQKPNYLMKNQTPELHSKMLQDLKGPKKKLKKLWNFCETLKNTLL